MPSVRIVLPTGVPAATPPPSPQTAAAAPRARDLPPGIAYLDNTKPNARQILELLDRAVRQSWPAAEGIHLRKAINTAPAEPLILDGVPAKARLFVTSTGD